MNILVNISNVRFGGGVTVVYQLLSAWLPVQQGNHIYILHPDGCGYEALKQGDGINLIPVPSVFHKSYPVKLYYNRVVFPRLVRKLKIDLVLSLGNIAFPSGNVPQLLLIQIAWLLYPESIAWQKIDRKSWLKNKIMCSYIRQNLKYATTWAFQTEAMRSRFLVQYGKKSSDAYILPNASVPEQSAVPLPDFDAPELRLLMLSRYYAYKNFEVLLPVAKMLKEQNIAVKIFITLDEQESVSAVRFLEEIKVNGVEKQIVNLGHIKQELIGETFANAHATILPTLIESFSGTYVESLFYGRPVLTSDMDFAVSICGAAGVYFDPVSPQSIFATIHKVYENRMILKEKSLHARAIAAQMDDWNTVALKLEHIACNLKKA